MEEKSHRDYLSIIGGTNATPKSYREKMWNKYYFRTYKFIVSNMIGNCDNKVALDVGTSYGNWYSFLKNKRFAKILGVELDPERASKAKEVGYNEVFNCDATNIPLENNSVDVAISNDVFVHILKLEDKISVLKEIYRILKNDGIFIFNHTISSAYGFEKYHILDYCSFLSLHELIRLVLENTDFIIEDVKPSYYHYRKISSPFIIKLLRRFIFFPGIPWLLFFSDYFISRRISIQEADTIYIKIRKN